MSWVWPWAVRMSHPSPNVQIMMLSIMDPDQSSYFRCRERLHLDLVPTVSCFHCGDKQAISFCESSWQFPDLSAVQLRSALRSDQGWAERGMLGLCTLAKAWREQRGEEGKVGREENVQVAAICSQKWKLSALQIFSVLSFGNNSIIILLIELRLSSSHSITSPDSVLLAADWKDVSKPCFAYGIIHLKPMLISMSWIFQLKKKNKLK